MKKSKYKMFGFTLAEIMLTFFIIGIISTASIGIYKAQLNLTKKYSYYATFMNLKKLTGELIALGSNVGTTTPFTFETLLPDKGNFVYVPVSPDVFDPLHEGFCQRAVEIVNTIGGVNCSLVKTSGTFNPGDANFTVSNGVRYFNFGSDPLGGAGDGTDYYQIFVDIDGAFGSGTINDDVMKFKVYRTGQVIPAVDSLGGLSTTYMSASVKYNDGASDQLLETSVPYLTAACHAGLVTGADCPVGLVKDPLCDTYTCEVVIAKP